MNIGDVTAVHAAAATPASTVAKAFATPASIAAEADALMAGLMAQPWGQVSPSVYETGRLVTLAPWLTGHARRVEFLVQTQRPDGGWVAPDPGYALVPTLSATEALLATLQRGSAGTGAASAADRGLRFLFRRLRGHDPLTMAELPDMPAIELIVPYLIGLINDRLDADDLHVREVWPSGDRLLPPAGMSDRKLPMIRALLGSGAQVPEKLLHALEVAGPAARRPVMVRPAATGTVGASPAATAAWLGESESPGCDTPARRYLEAAAAPHGGPVPCGLPITVFERAWVVSWLMRAGIRPTVPGELVQDLTATLGPAGTPAAAGLPADADTSAATLYALALLRAPHEPDLLSAYETPTHFCTWQGEEGYSITTNAHVLEAFGEYAAVRPQAGKRYASTIHKVAAWLREQQREDGSWLDRWHLSPFYATACATTALDRFDGESSAVAVRRALRWLLATQRPDGSWGTWSGTAEETAYAVQTLLLTLRPEASSPRRPAGWFEASCERAAARGGEYLLASPGGPDDPPLWHDKDLYLPTAIVRAAVLAALHLGQRRRPASEG